jgi:nifR3 family TIM-barrel protein
MSDTFWTKLKKPFFVLAPMADVTDSAFRAIITKYGKPDVLWTEFVSADGLLSPGREVLTKDLIFDKSERPIVAQIFSSHPDKILKATEIVRELGFDGIDINMGCPDKSVEKQGAGAALIKNPKLAREIIKAAKEGAKDIPVSVKTRIGYNKNEIETWISNILEEKVGTLTVHMRTRKDLSLVEAKWELMEDVLKLRDSISNGTLIIGNGDVKDLNDAKDKVSKYKVDGVMIGRGIFGNPWLFSDKNPSHIEKLKVLIEHTKKFEELCSHKSFSVMKKHYRAYVEGFPGAKELRIKLMETSNSIEVEELINDFLKRGENLDTLL